MKKSTSTHPQHSGTSKPSSKGRIKNVLLFAIPIIMIAAGAYILLLLFTPKLNKAQPKKTAEVIEEIKKTDQNTLLISTAGVYAPILEGGDEVLDKGLLHRVPKNGNPEIGGNFVVSGHSFVWGYTPQQVKEKSVFYNLSDVKVGDEIVAYWNKKLYYYTVIEKKTVKPNAIEIENKTKDPTLTVYTCTPAGSADGRIVLVAKPK